MIWRVTLYGKAKPNPGAVEGKPSLLQMRRIFQLPLRELSHLQMSQFLK